MSSQPLEKHRGCALSGRLHAGAATTQHTREPRQELSCARQVPAHPCTNPSSPEPVAAVAQLSQGCLTPWQVQQKQPRSQPGAVPPAAGTAPCSLPSHAGSTDRSRGTSCPGRAGGVSKAMTEQSLWWGQGCHGTDTAEQSPGCDCPQPCPRSLGPGREAPWQGRHPSELRGQRKGRREDQLGSNAGRSLWAWGEPRAQRTPGCRKPTSLPSPAPP